MTGYKVKIWKVEGYKGWSDYDGPRDYNFSRIVVMDAMFTEEDVLRIFLDRYKQSYRSIALKTTLLEEREINK